MFLYRILSSIVTTTSLGVMVVKGDGCEKDLRLVSREIHRRGEKLRNERSENLSFEVMGGWERQRWLEERVLPVGFILMISAKCLLKIFQTSSQMKQADRLFCSLVFVLMLEVL